MIQDDCSSLNKNYVIEFILNNYHIIDLDL